MELMTQLYPICRSITGPGLRESLDLISDWLPLQRSEIPSGTRVLDWEIPPEWIVRDASIQDQLGNRIVDFQQHNLHVLNYSEPIDKTLTWQELEPHLHWLSDHPNRIPYRTSYYERRWGFCITGEQRSRLSRDPHEKFRVVIDAEHIPGSLSYGEHLIRGKTNQEVLVSAHVCHPSLANDNLSGVAVAVALASLLEEQKRKNQLHYSYRFLFAPGTIGAISWLSRNPDAKQRIHHGLVLTLLGDDAPIRFKATRQTDSELNKLARYLSAQDQLPLEVVPFSPMGYDERQYGSPGIDLSIGRLHRSNYDDFDAYHTSADNLSIVKPARLAESAQVALRLLLALDQNQRYLNVVPIGEPHFARRGVDYSKLVSGKSSYRESLAWLLNLADGTNSLLDIAELSGQPFDDLCELAQRLLALSLLTLTNN